MPTNRPLYAPPQAQHFKKARIMPKICFRSKICNTLFIRDIINYREAGSELMDLKLVNINQFDHQKYSLRNTVGNSCYLVANNKSALINAEM